MSKQETDRREQVANTDIKLNDCATQVNENTSTDCINSLGVWLMPANQQTNRESVHHKICRFQSQRKPETNKDSSSLYVRVCDGIYPLWIELAPHVELYSCMKFLVHWCPKFVPSHICESYCPQLSINLVDEDFFLLLPSLSVATSLITHRVTWMDCFRVHQKLATSSIEKAKWKIKFQASWSCDTWSCSYLLHTTVATKWKLEKNIFKFTST